MWITLREEVTDQLQSKVLQGRVLLTRTGLGQRKREEGTCNEILSDFFSYFMVIRITLTDLLLNQMFEKLIGNKKKK